MVASISRPAAPKKSTRELRLVTDAPNKHQLKTEEMRRKLLKSARTVFARDGFEGARLEEIAGHAGHTRGAFYAHFASKEDLFFALLEQQIYGHLEIVRALLDAADPSRAKLEVLRDHYVLKLEDQNWSMLMLEFKMYAIRHPKLRAKLAAAHRAMRKSVHVQDIADLMEAHCQNDHYSAGGLRVILEAFLQGLILQRAYDPISLSAEDASQALRRVFDILILGG